MKKSIYKKVLFGFILLLISKLCAQEHGETYYFQSAIGDKYLTVKNFDSSDGTPLVNWSYSGESNQQFTLEDTEDGYFMYLKSGIGKYVHVQDESSQTKALALIWEGKGNDNTKWRLQPTTSPNYFLIQSKKGTYLNVKDDEDADGAPIWMWTYSESDAQKWKLIPVEEKNEQDGRIKTIALDALTNLCPNAQVGGDLEFDGNGPKITGSIEINISSDKKRIEALVRFNAQETKSDGLTGRSEVEGTWVETIYYAPDGLLISEINSGAISKFEKILQGGGRNEAFQGGDGDQHLLKESDDFLSSGGPVKKMAVVGDTGGWDISTDNNCSNDTRIEFIEFNDIEVEFKTN